MKEQYLTRCTKARYYYT